MSSSNKNEKNDNIDNTDTSTNDTTPSTNSGGRPATAQEAEQINGILEMLRQQNLNVTNIPMSQNGTVGAGAGTGVAGNLIAENLDLSGIGGGAEDGGRKKHAFWDTQVS